MAIHPHHALFRDNIAPVTGGFIDAPAAQPDVQNDVNQRALESEQAGRVSFYQQNEEGFAGNMIVNDQATGLMAARNGAPKSEEEKRNDNYRLQMHSVQASLITKETLDNIRISQSHIKSWTESYADSLQERHDRAVANLSVSEDKILMGENGQPATAADRASLEAEQSACSTLLVQEDLVMVNGVPFRDTSGEFIVRSNYDTMITTMEEQQLIEDYQSGDVSFDSLTQEHQISLIKSLPADEQQKIYDQLPEGERAALEEAVDAAPDHQMESVLDQLNQYQYSRSSVDMTYNDGDIIPGQLTQPFSLASDPNYVMRIGTDPDPGNTPANTMFSPDMLSESATLETDPAPVSASFQPVMKVSLGQ